MPTGAALFFDGATLTLQSRNDRNRAVLVSANKEELLLGCRSAGVKPGAIVGGTLSYSIAGNFLGILPVCTGAIRFFQNGSSPLCRMKPPFDRDERLDVLLPLAGTLAALIILLAILVL